jgi:type II restriction/modification system DNA methylase subunit YeeA
MYTIPIPGTAKIEAIETLVQKILSAKSKNSSTNVSKLERQIDKLVYQLYGLTEEEIAIVEGKL